MFYFQGNGFPKKYISHNFHIDKHFVTETHNGRAAESKV